MNLINKNSKSPLLAKIKFEPRRNFGSDIFKQTPPSLAEASYGGRSPLSRLRRRVSLMSWYVYVLNCKNNTPYIGCTQDLKERIERH